jgi:hypothetical protein
MGRLAERAWVPVSRVLAQRLRRATGLGSLRNVRWRYAVPFTLHEKLVGVPVQEDAVVDNLAVFLDPLGDELL